MGQRSVWIVENNNCDYDYDGFFCVNALSGFLLDLNFDITFHRRGFGFPLQITITWIFLYSTTLFSHQSSMLVGFTVVKCIDG
jgi:hypothetical protein